MNGNGLYIENVQLFRNQIISLKGIEKLRQTNGMIETIINNRKSKKKNRWQKPLGIVIDNTEPGKIIVRGNLVVENLKYLFVLIHSIAETGHPDIHIDLNKVSTIDRECVAYLLHLYLDLKRRGGKLHILGPHKDILKLFKLYEVYV